MEPSRDNPITRFSAFWLALGIFLIFAILLGAFLVIDRRPKTDLEAAAAKTRYEIKQKVDAAEAASLPAEAIEASIPKVAKEIVAAKPVAVEIPQQVVPGTPTALKLAPPAAPAEPKPAGEGDPAKPENGEAAKPGETPAAPSEGSPAKPAEEPAAPAQEPTTPTEGSPAAPATPQAPTKQPADSPESPSEGAPSKPDGAPAPDTSFNEVIDPAVMEFGRAQFLLCAACHGQAGQGGLAPALAGSEWVTGPVENLVRIQLRGIKGPIKVKGTVYDIPGGMMPMAYQTDEQIAAVLTYTRNSFGNKASSVKPAQVAALRTEVGKPQLTAEDLILP